jgi:RNA polymerase sigma-70 factor, ECF subfamily
MGMLYPSVKRIGDGPSGPAEARQLAAAHLVSPSDEELLARIRQGDQRSLIEVYDRHQARLYQFVYSMCGDPGTAADVIQDVFLLMLERGGPAKSVFSRFNPEKGGLEGYLFGIARKLARKVVVKQSRWLPIDEEMKSPGAFAEKIESMSSLDRLRSAIALLPVKYREIIVLCCLQERSYEQAAALLGCSTGTIASRLSRARKLLAERLGAKEREPQNLGRDRLGHIIRQGTRS